MSKLTNGLKTVGNQLIFRVSRFLKALALTPAMSANEMRFFESHLGKNDVVFEWGAGGSTLRFSKRVKTYYSVEHSKKWYDKLKTKIDDNVSLMFVATTGKYPDYAAFNTLGDGELADFWDYAHAFQRVEEAPTIFLVDGRVRLDCLRLIAQEIEPDTKVFLHDFYRYEKDLPGQDWQLEKVVETLGLIRAK